MSLRPKVLKAGIVVTDYQTGDVRSVIPFQYNPETLTRTLTAQLAASTGALVVSRFTGVAVETIRFEATLDAFEPLFQGDATTGDYGIHPALAVLERLVQPTSTALLAARGLAQSGELEVLQEVAPQLLLVWGSARIQPVTITELAVTEHLFDTSLNPLRATVGITATVLTPDQLGFSSRGGALAVRHLQATEDLARRAPAATVASLGVTI